MDLKPILLDVESPEFSRIKKIRNFMLNINPSIDIERARIYTSTYKKYESYPKIMIRALALKELLLIKKINIFDGEIIVGDVCSNPRDAYIYPEYSVDFILDEIDGKPYRFNERPGDRFEIEQKEIEELKEICCWWQGKTTRDLVMSILPEDTMKVYNSGVINVEWLLTGGQGHLVPDFKFVLDFGLKGLEEKVNEQLLNIDITQPEAINKISFYNSVKIIIDAVKDYGKRFSKLALEQAEYITNQERRRELKEISRICNKVPYYPAENLHEAIQSLWFIHSILQIEDSGHSMSLGRIDQTLNKFYKIEKNVNSNLTTSLTKTVELFACLWLKLFGVNKVRSWEATQYNAGYPMFQNLTIGGQKKFGIDATNELSFIILMTQSLVKLSAPSISLRYHNNIDEMLIDFALDVIDLGGGQPAIYNDEVLIPSLISRGFEIDDALNYNIVGCVEPHVEGKQGYRPNGACFFNLPKILELTIFNGQDIKNQTIINKNTKKIEECKSFEDFYQEVKNQIIHYMRYHVFVDNTVCGIFLEYMPNAFVSSLISDCIDKGLTIDEGGAHYEMMGNLMVGLANLGNSLASIKKNIFEDKKITIDEMKLALIKNFDIKDGSRIKNLFENSPKYGNDDDYVDNLTADIFEFICRNYAKNKTIRFGKGPVGGYWVPSTSTVSANIPLGQYLIASPDGRNAYEPVADGISPFMGSDKKGPTAAIKSIGKLNNLLVTGGQLYNTRFNPNVIKTNKKALIDLIKTYCGDYKGMHIQFNIIDSKTLREAQKKPENYKNLMVRVAGYSALFTSLDKEVQDVIIGRTEHMGF